MPSQKIPTILLKIWQLQSSQSQTHPQLGTKMYKTDLSFTRVSFVSIEIGEMPRKRALNWQIKNLGNF